MSTFDPRRLILWMAVSLCVVGVPTVVRADPVDDLGAALKLNIGGLPPDLQLAAKRNKLIEAAIPEIKTIEQLRRAYFKLSWPVKLDNVAKVVDTEHYRVEIGKKLEQALKAAADDANVERQQAVALLIAEIAPKPEDRKKGDAPRAPTQEIKAKVKPEPVKEQFARRLTGLVRGLCSASDVLTRQAALNALGKITPDPKEAFPVLKATLEKDELGPRRFAAYAIVDLIKNADYLDFKEKVETIEQAIATASLGLRDTDEFVRGYSLQALEESTRMAVDLFLPIDLIEVKGKKSLRPEQKTVLRAYQTANGPLVRALRDANLKVRLGGVQALDQIGLMRGKVIQALREISLDESNTSDLLKAFDAPDALGEIVGNLGKVTPLLEADDVRLRRGAIDFLEMVGDQAEPAVAEITLALRDADRFVRWSAARTIANIAPAKIGDEAIRTLGTMVIEADPEISRAAAQAIEAIGPAAHDAVDWLGFVTANGDTDSRNWDTETRVAAMRALISIGSPAGLRAIPKVLTALTDTDVRVRRQAAITLARLGRPADVSLANQEVVALRRAERDDDSEVRLNAAEAILNITKSKKAQ